MNKAVKRIIIFFVILLSILVLIAIIWTVFSLVGRVSADSLIPESAGLRLSVENPMKLLDGFLAHEPLQEISSVPALASAIPLIKSLEENELLKNKFVRLAARGNLEMALFTSADGHVSRIMLSWDMGFFSPLLRILPTISNFLSIPNLYYVQAGKNSRFEYRMEDMVLYIGPYRNLLLITNNSAFFESRAAVARANNENMMFNIIKPSQYDAALLLSSEFVAELLAGQNETMAAALNNIEFSSAVEAGLSLFPKKLELRLTAPASSGRAELSRFLAQRTDAPVLIDRLPASSQYATVLSAGTLDELYQAAAVFSGDALNESIKTADSASRALLGLTLNDLLFSWSGKEFAAFGMEGRPHPVYAIQINNEKKRQEVFNKAFKSFALNENVSLSLDGTRIPRIEVPDFLQSLLRRWDIFIPSPYYTVYKDFLYASESAETLLAAIRSIQKNDSLIKTMTWRNIAGGKASSSAFSLYYSLDLSMPFFLRNNTALSGFLGIYRQGLLRMSFNKGIIDVSLSLIPGSGSGVMPVNGYPLDVGRGSSNQIYGASKGDERRIFFTRGSSALSVNPADNSIKEIAGQSPLWVIPAHLATQGAAKNDIAAWVVTGQGRATLVDGDMEPAPGFPVLTGIRLSAPPASYGGKLYLGGEDGRVYTVDMNGEQGVWETSFPAALRSAPSFFSIPTKQGLRSYAAVYPKSFFGEIWLLDSEGKVLPNWPAPVSGGFDDEDFAGGSGIAFGSPLLFAHNNKIHAAFVTQDGELSVFDENADCISPFPIMLEGVFYQQPVFDGDYLWLVSADGVFFQVSFAGEILYQNIPGFSVKEEGSIIVFDYDGNKVPEIFISGEGNALYGYNRHFRSLEGFPLPVWGKPLFTEAAGNAKAEIIGIGMDMKLYRWRFK